MAITKANIVNKETVPPSQFIPFAINYFEHFVHNFTQSIDDKTVSIIEILDEINNYTNNVNMEDYLFSLT